MILPAVITVFVFSYMPMYGLIIAFKNFNVFKGVLGSPWARHNGFEHFIDFFNSASVWNVLRNTLALAFLSLVFVQIPPMIFAILLNEIRSRIFKRMTQTVSYLPHFISWVVIGGIVFVMFLPTRSAPVNKLLLALGAVEKPTDIMNNPDTIWIVFIVDGVPVMKPEIEALGGTDIADEYYFNVLGGAIRDNYWQMIARQQRMPEMKDAIDILRPAVDDYKDLTFVPEAAAAGYPEGSEEIKIYAEIKEAFGDELMRIILGPPDRVRGDLTALLSKVEGMGLGKFNLFQEKVAKNFSEVVEKYRY